MKANELREKFLRFFESKGHKIISGASVIPENDPTVLFTTAGMHPLIPYLLGQKHPAGTRLTDVQKCIRTGDIDEVGDKGHLTSFEMLGNWSLGDYFKEDAIKWSWEFLTSPEYLGIDPKCLAFSVFAGDEDSPRDTEAYQLWRSCGVKEENIFFLPKENNWWWCGGATGPCGPDTEMFIIDESKPPCSPDCSPSCDCGRYLEIWNDVFMQYNKNADGSLSALTQKNVDTGMGLERTLCILNGAKTVYDTELFSDILNKIAELSGKKYDQSEEITRAFRIIADHVRTSTIILGDIKGVTPSNVDQGYVLRRLIRRAIRFASQLDMPKGALLEVSKVIINQYKEAYPEIKEKEAFIIEQLSFEEDRFSHTLIQGIREFEKLTLRLGDNKQIDGQNAFHLYDTYGFPIEFTLELAKEKGYTVDVAGFEECFKEHQAKSAAGAEQRFKGGLADHSIETSRLHTATHLLHSALRKVLGEEVKQKGSNITTERLRFDFSFSRKMTPEELKEVERLVNESIKADVQIICDEIPLEEAKKSGAIGLFESKYDTIVKMYTMGSFSKEICGGPHAEHTGELGTFVIQKEESSSAGVRRIKAILKQQ